jgi:hypothetical protein
MRAVFTFDLPMIEGEFVDSLSLTKFLEELGWSFQTISEMTPADVKAIVQAQKNDRDVTLAPIASPAAEGAEATQRQQAGPRYSLPELCGPLFDEMPEVAAAERSATVFLGYIANDQTIFVVTRMVKRQVTFRLLHRQLPKLQSSTVRMIEMLLPAAIDNKHPIRLSSKLVSVYERHFDHVIITGRVITDPFRETWRSNFKDALLVIVPTFLLLPTFASLYYAHPADTLLYGTLERLSTALITAALVSALGLYTAWREIRRHKLIDWSVDNPSGQGVMGQRNNGAARIVARR